MDDRHKHIPTSAESERTLAERLGRIDPFVLGTVLFAIIVIGIVLSPMEASRFYYGDF